MSEQRPQGPPEGWDADGILWVLLRDLTVLSRAQARLLGDLTKLIEQMRRGAIPAGIIGGAVPGEIALSTVSAGAPAAAVDAPIPESPKADTVLPPPAAAPEALEAPVAVAPVPAMPAPAPEAPAPEVPAPTPEVPPISTHEREALVGEEHGVGGNGRLTPVTDAPTSAEIELDREVLIEGPEDEDEGVNEDAPVLTLESGDARVGVLWDHVIQIGSIGTPTIPEKVETERGIIELVSLGLLLHGISREEKYFVVLEQDTERAAVACERMLGVGPLGAAIMQEKGGRIQVLRVPMLRTFAASANPASGNGGSLEEQKAADERDRHGPLRALVAVRYLPARVAICRHLRGRGWQVGEAAGLEAATVSLDLGRWDLLFLEAHGNGESEATEGLLLRRVVERGVPVIRVGSRVSGFPGREGPALMFPFSEPELDAILSEKRGNVNI